MQQPHDPSKKPDDGTPKPKIFYQILNSKNKDFGRILRTSNSGASLNSYEEIGGEVNQTPIVHNVNASKIASAAYRKSRGVMIAEKFLSLRLRMVMRHWNK